MRPPLRLALLLGLLLLGCTSSRAPVLVRPPDTHAVPRPILFRNVAVFDGIDPDIVPGLDVLVINGRVAGIAATGVHPPPDGVVVVEGEGRTLLPGLVDAHVRLSSSLRAGGPATPELQAEALLYGGVTSVANVGHDDDVEKLQRRIADGAVAGPRLHRSTRLIAAEKPADSFASSPFSAGTDVAVVNSPKAAARAARKDFEYLRSDFAAVAIEGLEGKELRAVVAEANAYKKPTFALAGSPAGARTAAESNVQLLLAVPWSHELSIEDAEAIVFSNVAVVTTLSAFRNLLRAQSGDPAREPLAERIAGSAVPTLPMPEVDPEALKRQLRTVEKNLLLLRQVGAHLVVGSGAGLPGAIHGASIHDEIEALVELGIPAGEVLQMATSRAVAFLHPEARFGVIAPGAYADLLLVDGNPAEDPKALRRIEGMWQAGIPIERLTEPSGLPD